MPITETAVALAGLRWVASPVVKELVKKSISYLGTDITKGLEDLETTLLPQFQLTIQAAQHSPHKAQLTRWLDRMKNAYFDAEAILHELEYERLKRKAKGDDKKLLVRLSSKPIIKPLAKFTCRVVKKASLLSPQKRKLLKRLNELKEIAAEAKNLHDLLGIQNTGSIQNAGNNTFVTTSLLGNADKVFGRDGDREEIISFLLDEQEGSSPTKRYSVVAITGMGGAGKTTLAKYVYNDPKVQKHFDVKMWLCLSQNMDIIELTKAMIEHASGKRPDLFNLNILQEELVKKLSDNKKVIVVLDNFWYDNNDGVAEKQHWENLLKPFDSRRGTCKIVVTSRSSGSFPIELEPEKLIILSDLAPDDFKSLLRYHAIDSLQISNPQMKNYLSDMSHMVDQIVKKMSKLPLAAKVVGNQLRERPEISFWQDTLEKVNLSDIMDILLWSFHRFDVQLQRCFLFCSIFPKNTIFPYGADDLVPYWVALDFIQPSDDHNNSVEEICLKYFQKMVANSIFQLVDKVYHMHDLFYDLAEKLSVGDCFRVTNVEREIPSTVQHVFLKVNNEILKEKLSSICNLSNLRTLILGNPFIDNISEIISKISTKNFRNLRVLDVWSRGYKTVPRIVGDFRNLRLLDFTRSSIEALPDSVLQLYHLQFLILPSSVKTLPNKLSNLIKLRRIEMYDSDAKLVNTLPPVPYLSKLTSLQHLNEFHVRKEKGYELQQLGCLKEIGGSLRIVNLENASDKDEAVTARLIDKPKLKKLELVWDESAQNNGLEIEVIEALRPPTNLESLTIGGYRGSRFPTWLQEGSIIENIKNVKFYNCNTLTNLPQNFHQFRHCSELVLQNLGCLRELSTFPEYLSTLSIIKCPSLILVCENELQVSFEQNFICSFEVDTIDVLDHELKSFEQTCSNENCAELLRITKSSEQTFSKKNFEERLHIIGRAGEDNSSEFREQLEASNQFIELYLKNLNSAWWCCHQQRMNFIFSLPPQRTQANKLKLPFMLRVLHLGYCCVSDGVLSGCLRGMATLEELYLSGIMTISTLPPTQFLKSLQSLRVLEIKHCWYLRSLGGLHALPNLQSFLVRDCWSWLEMDSPVSPLPPTLQSFIINRCVVPPGIFNGDLPCLQTVEINDCYIPASFLSFRQLTLLESLSLIQCFGLEIIQGLESRPFISTLQLIMLPDLAVESVLESWQGCREKLSISSLVMMNKLLSSQDFVPPQWLSIRYCQEEVISFEKFDHLQSIKTLRFISCENLRVITALSYFSTLEQIVFMDCPKISELPELPGSIQHIMIRGCPVLRERCLPNGLDWNKIQCIQDRWIE